MNKRNTNILGGVAVTLVMIIGMFKRKKKEVLVGTFPEFPEIALEIDLGIEKSKPLVDISSIKQTQSIETQSVETVEKHVYSKMSVKELRRIASIQKVKNYSKLKKDDLLKALQFYLSHSE
jgi:hypothetical protein